MVVVEHLNPFHGTLTTEPRSAKSFPMAVGSSEQKRMYDTWPVASPTNGYCFK